MPIDIPLILHAVLEDYALPWGGEHGIAHWARVLENGLRLAGETGADVEVVRLFAVLHDSRRVNEHTDPDHGPRAAEFAMSLRGRLIDLPDHEFRLLHRACHGHTHERTHPDVTVQTCWDADRLDLGACHGHTHERTHPDVTVQTCWDADRLDLGRVGIMPHPNRLCTETARRPEMIRWADGRATVQVVPEFVWEEWGIDPGDLRPGSGAPWDRIEKSPEGFWGRG
jgi:uncharacterized protein